MQDLMKFFSVLLITAILFGGCGKEESFQIPKNPPSSLDDIVIGKPYGWATKVIGDTVKYRGCISSAEYGDLGMIPGIDMKGKFLSIQLTDSVDNVLGISLYTDNNGNLTKGAYTEKRGAMLFVKNDLTTYTSKSFTVYITNITESLIELSFSANFVNMIDSGDKFKFEGKLKALIGRTNPC